MRIGVVVRVIAEKKFGFIRSGDLREDVFFHFSKVPSGERRFLAEGDEVEFEIDELARLDRSRLQATLVRRATKPLSAKMRPSDEPEARIKHHPKALRRRPDWRKKE